MTSLGDSFPQELKNEFVSRNIKSGVVIKAFVTDTKPPKEKRFILISEKYDKLVFATVFINSEINPNIFKNEEVKKLHVLFEKNERAYIDHPSYVDCSQLIFRDKSWLEGILNEDSSRLIGELSSEDFEAIKGVIKSAKTIPISKKKEFGLYL